MIIAAMLDQSKRCLISPLSLKKIERSWISNFREELEQVILEVLLDTTTVEPVAPDIELVAGISVIQRRHIVKDGRGRIRDYHEWLTMSDNHISFWLCASCAFGEARYWCYSHFQLATLTLPAIHDRFVGADKAGVIDLVITELLFSLQEKRAKINLFVEAMEAYGAGHRVL